MEQKKKVPVLTIRDLSITFRTTAGPVNAIRGVNIDLMRGETLAIVGESGSGKSVTFKAVMGILAKNSEVNSGSIKYSYFHDDGSPAEVDILKMKKGEIRRHINGKRIAMIFQDPMTSLDPTMPIGRQIMEGMLWHYKMKKDEAYKKAVRLLEEVGLDRPEKRMKQYPHQLSGGMRQRVVIAIALACSPGLLIADEPTTALDVTIQAQVLEMMKNLKEQYNTSMLMITHDLGIVAEVCDCVSVIYAGRVVEHGTLEDVFDHTLHPYTKGLFNSLPNMKDRKARLQPIPGLMPDPSRLPEGCAFADRCRYATDRCFHERPEVLHRTEEHTVACHLYTPENIQKGGVLDHE